MKINSYLILREDGKLIAWVNGQFVGVITEDESSKIEHFRHADDSPSVPEKELTRIKQILDEKENE